MIEAALGRLSAMKGKLLGYGFWDKLLCGSDKDAIGALAGTHYAEAVRRVGDAAPVATLERALWREVFVDWAKLVKFLEGPFADCAKSLCRTFGTDNIRRTVRRILAGTAPELGIPLWELGPLEEVSAAELTQAKSIADLSGVLAGGPFASAFELASHRLAEGETLFGFEQVLESACRESILRLASNLRGHAGPAARAYIEMRNHFTNLRWALRLRFVKGMKPEEARQYLSRPYSARTKAELEAVLTAESLEQASATLAGLPCVRLSGELTPAAIERALRRGEATWARRELRRAFFQFSSLLAYYDVRSQEVRDIIVILTGLRQGRTPEDIKARLGLAA